MAAVTGGAGGIGASVARALAEAGARVVVVDRDRPNADRVAAAIVADGGAARAATADVTDEASVDALFADIVALDGKIDVLVNNAGIAIRRPAVDLALADWEAVVSVNMTGAFLCARTAARHMIAAGRGGVIVNTASIMGMSGGGLYPNISYQTTKGGLVNMTRALAIEWAPHRIRVNAVAPTYVRTGLIAPLLARPEIVARIEAMTPLGRLAEPDEIAAAILFLASSRRNDDHWSYPAGRWRLPCAIGQDHDWPLPEK